MSGCMGTLRMRGLRGRDQPAHLDHRGGSFLRGIARPGRPFLLQRQPRLGMGGDGILCQRRPKDKMGSLAGSSQAAEAWVDRTREPTRAPSSPMLRHAAVVARDSHAPCILRHWLKPRVRPRSSSEAQLRGTRVNWEDVAAQPAWCETWFSCSAAPRTGGSRTVPSAETAGGLTQSDSALGSDRLKRKVLHQLRNVSSQGNRNRNRTCRSPGTGLAPPATSQ